MDLDEIIFGLVDQAKKQLSHVTDGDEWDDIHMRDAHVLLEAAEALRRQSTVMNGMGLTHTADRRDPV